MNGEQNHIDRQFERLFEFNKHLAQKVERIERGVYGDPENKVLGLIDTDKNQHERIKDLEDIKKKVVFWCGGLIVGLEVIHWLKDKI